ncbi:TetR/AcrR family transcriptional regulator [Nocardia higoensis]|uniref:TetR/AcrR family transcriptional regulator n=1 Tax=Nocardia higoensis TaxID=228599 RepID=UPI0005940CDD|nr:TetR/AcrR family transcriptional regulator [Nocardia higoensis]
MTRSKTQSDEQVLDAALALVREKGIGSLTFAGLADRCGLSAPTLVQRFATKTGLTRRTLLHAWDTLEARTRELIATTPRTPEGALELLIGLSRQYDESGTYGEGLLVLREDVRDPVLRRRGVAWEEELVAELDARLNSVAEGAGFALAAYWQGTVTWWAFRGEPSLETYLTDKLREFIALLA